MRRKRMASPDSGPHFFCATVTEFLRVRSKSVSNRRESRSRVGLS
jgi:hypothetical protein